MSVEKQTQTLKFNPDVIKQDRINQDYVLAWARKENGNSPPWNNNEWVNDAVEAFVKMGFHSEIENLILHFPFESIKLISGPSLVAITKHFKKHPIQLAALVVYLGWDHSEYLKSRSDDSKSGDLKKYGPTANMIYLKATGVLTEWQKIIDENSNNPDFISWIEDIKKDKQFPGLKFK